MNKKNKPQGNFDDALEALRQNALKNVEETSASEQEFVTPKEMKGRRSAWIIRGLIVMLFLAGIAEAFILINNRAQIDLIKYEDIPSAETYGEPENAPLPTPTEIILIEPEPALEIPPEEPALEAPEPEPIPLPEGVEEIPFPEDGES